jgi:hypothetical protein
MSFRVFIYYCALCGGWSALAGWAVGRILSPDIGARVRQAGIRGLFLGLMVALGLGLVDALWNLTLRRWGQVAMRVLVAVLVGAVGGLIGGMLGQWLLDRNEFLFIFGWTLTGLLIGTSIGVYEILAGLMRQENVTLPRRKLIKCLVGGAVGGLLGGLLALFLRNAWHKAFGDKDPDWLWSPTAWGFVALGMCIGLLVGLAQVILKEAWIKVEAGFRPGREMILSKEKTTIGRAEACDLGLFGDPTIEKLHASIIQSGSRYFVEDAGTPGGTYLNDRPVGGRVGLNSGDLIRVGRSVLRFNERQKRSS